ncbi:unnamed protein product [Cochlearia groenlandica]
MASYKSLGVIFATMMIISLVLCGIGEARVMIETQNKISPVSSQHPHVLESENHILDTPQYHETDYLSYGTLLPDKKPGCTKPNPKDCISTTPANPYHRGCEDSNRCRRDL